MQQSSIKAVVSCLIERFIKIVALFDKQVGSTPKKICIGMARSYTALGDNIILNAIVNITRSAFPQAHITMVIVEEHEAFLRMFYEKHTQVDRVIVFPSRRVQYISFLRNMRREHYDIYLGHFECIVPAPFSCLAGIQKRIGYARSTLDKKFLTESFSFPRVDQHWSDYAGLFAKALGQEMDSKEMVKVEYTQETLSMCSSGLIIAFHVGGSRGWNRRWRLDKFMEICVRLTKQYRAKILLLGGMEDINDNQVIVDAMEARFDFADIQNLAGSTLNRTANYLKRSDLFIGNDSGPLHFAVALDIPTISFFGPSYYFQVRPDKVDAKHIALTKHPEGFKCKDCSVEACKHRVHPNEAGCLTDLEMEDVWPVIQKCLEKNLISKIN